MTDNGASGITNGLLASWLVEVVDGSALPRGAYSMVELDEATCALERPGGLSFEIPAADIVQYEKMGLLRVVSTIAAVNDNSDDAGK